MTKFIIDEKTRDEVIQFFLSRNFPAGRNTLLQLEEIKKENEELLELVKIPFKQRTEEQNKRIYELINFKQEEKNVE